MGTSSSASAATPTVASRAGGRGGATGVPPCRGLSPPPPSYTLHHPFPSISRHLSSAVASSQARLSHVLPRRVHVIRPPPHTCRVTPFTRPLSRGNCPTRSAQSLPDGFFIANTSPIPSSLRGILDMADINGTTGFTSVNAAQSPTITPSASSATPASAAATGEKRKRESKGGLKFYAVRVGKDPGIYHSWAECLDQVRGFPKAMFKSFTSLTEAQHYVAGEDVGHTNSVSKYYGVQIGRNPGVYTTWPEVLEQITGCKGPKHKVFKSRTEAEAFVAEGREQNGDAMKSIEAFDAAGPASKKVKISKNKSTSAFKKENVSPDEHLQFDPGSYSPGSAPLPEDVEDNFDTSITLDHTTDSARYKTSAELTRSKYVAIGPAPLAPVRIYTDGSSLSNGTAASIGGVGVYFGPGDKRNLSEALPGTKQTNQRAELTAIMRALEIAPKDRRIVVYTDSQYAIRCLVEWSLNWRRNGWLNSSRKPVENRDLIQKVIDMLDGRLQMNEHREWDDFSESRTERGNAQVVLGKLGYQKGPWEQGPGGVEFVWVKGHGADEGNNAADSLATAGAREAQELIQDVQLE